MQGSESISLVTINTQTNDTHFRGRGVQGTTSKVSLVLLVVDHVCESGPKVRVYKLAVLEFEFEARVKRNDQRRFPALQTTGVSTCKYKNKQHGGRLLFGKCGRVNVTTWVRTCGTLNRHTSVR
jgi:hypothetical protein